MTTEARHWLSVCLLLGATAGWSADRYVDPAGSDLPGCTDPGSPCRTIQHAVAESSGRDIVHLAPGNYVENVVLSIDLTIVGDAFSRPMLEALESAKQHDEPYDLSSIFLILSSGVMWSAPIKQALLGYSPRMRLLDSLGSSEGVGFAAKLESDPSKATTASFSLGEFTKVITDEGKEVVPGSGERGRLALGGPLPTGYYNDPKKSEETWPTIEGRRYSIPGDYATIEKDGTIILLGRGSACINPQQDDVLVAVNAQIDYGEHIAGFLTFEPELLARPAVVGGFAGFHRKAKSLCIHEGEH